MIKLTTEKILIFDGFDNDEFYLIADQLKEFDETNFQLDKSTFSEIVEDLNLPTGIEGKMTSSNGHNLYYLVNFNRIISLFSLGEKQPARFNIYLEGIWLLEQKSTLQVNHK
jgi:hypothetical protein